MHAHASASGVLLKAEVGEREYLLEDTQFGLTTHIDIVHDVVHSNTRKIYLKHKRNLYNTCGYALIPVVPGTSQLETLPLSISIHIFNLAFQLLPAVNYMSR